MSVCPECKWEDAGHPLRHADDCSRMPRCACGHVARGQDPDGSFVCFSCPFPPRPEGVQALDREALGRLVRDEWVRWAREQPNPKPSWLTPWSDLSESEREVDRRIGERVANAVRQARNPCREVGPASGSFERP
jgi:hypothetical protein